MMTYHQARAFVESFSHSGAPVRNLNRIAGLLSRLDNPQDKLHFVHIAGTNGKGSVTEFCSRALAAAGYRTGTLTSPYIRHYRDRIRLNAADIPREDFCRCCEAVASAVGKEQFSQFEITMAIALLYFLQADADIVVLEAGIGGLLDATNVIAPPLVSVITAVSMDHMQLLGNTVEEIAAQKAGILKTGSEAVFSADSRPEALRVLTETAGCLHIPYHIPDVSQCVTESCTLMGSSFMYKHHPYVLQMGGEHQIQNAITALEVLELLRRKGFILSEEIVAGAFSETAVPARIQLIQEKPPIILDGGHNADGVEALVRTLKQNGGKWVGICGMTNTKDAETASEKLASVLETVFCVDGFTERAFSKDMLAAAFTAHHVPAKKAALAEALPQALKWAHEHDAGVVICGSLYLANYYLKQ